MLNIVGRVASIVYVEGSLPNLINRSQGKPAGWSEIDQAGPDEEPLTEEELRQLNSDAGYVSGEEAKREFGLQTNLP